MISDNETKPATGGEDKFNAQSIEAGRLLFAQACEFQLGVASLEQVPDSTLPEIAFAGRSNVGKSSIVNALTGRRTLARTSHTPGRTQQINFFLLSDKLHLADLPGYGYARVSKSQVQDWTRLVNDYLRGRSQLRRVLLLIDSRHGLKDSDRTVMTMLDKAAVSYQIILTKCDKAKGAKLNEVIEKTATEIATHPAAHPDIIATSAHKKLGVEELRATLAALAALG